MVNSAGTVIIHISILQLQKVCCMLKSFHQAVAIRVLVTNILLTKHCLKTYKKKLKEKLLYMMLVVMQEK